MKFLRCINFYRKVHSLAETNRQGLEVVTAWASICLGSFIKTIGKGISFAYCKWPQNGLRKARRIRAKSDKTR